MSFLKCSLFLLCFVSFSASWAASLSSDETNALFIKNFATALNNLDVIRIQEPGKQGPVHPPFFLDMRDTFSNTEIRSMIISGMVQASKKYQFQHVCGTPLTGRRWAAYFAKTTDTDQLVIDQGRVEGKFKRGESCLLLDDVLKSGHTVMESIHSIKNSGLQVAGVIVAIDREEGGKDLLTAQKTPLTVLCSLSEILETLGKEKKVSEDQIQSVLNYTKRERQKRLQSIHHPYE